MNAQRFTQETGYELEETKPMYGLTEYKLITKDSLYSIFSKIECLRSIEDFRVEIHDNDVCVYF